VDRARHGRGCRQSLVERVDSFRLDWLFEGQEAAIVVEDDTCVAPEFYDYDLFFSPRFSSWAWATWRNRWQAFTFDRSFLRGQLAARKDLRPERAGAEMLWMIEHAVVDESRSGRGTCSVRRRARRA